MELNISSNLDLKDLPEPPVVEFDLSGTLEAIAEVSDLITEMEEGRQECLVDTAALERIYDMSDTIDEHGMSPALIGMFGEQMEKFAPSFLTGDKDVVLKELQATQEGLELGVKKKFSDFASKFRESLRKMFSSNEKIRRNIQQLVKGKGRFKGDLTKTLNTKVVAYDLKAVLFTLNMMEEVLHKKKPIAFPKFNSKVLGDDAFKVAETAMTKHGESFDMAKNDDCIMAFVSSRNMYGTKTHIKRYSQSIQDTGVETLADIIKLGQGVLDSIYSKNIGGDYWEVMDAVITELDKFPGSEMRTARRIYWMLADANSTAFGSSMHLANDFALQAVATLAAVK